MNARGFSPIVVTAALSILAFVTIFGWSTIKTTQQKNAATTFVAAPEANDLAARGGPSVGTLASSTPTPSAAGDSPLGSAILSGLINEYVVLQGQGTYTPAAGIEVAGQMATTLKAPLSYQTYTPSNIKTDSDTSYDAMMKYRANLRDSLAPLLKSTQPEYEIFAQYVDTKDQSYLTTLKTVAQNYRDAADATAQVTVPIDAVTHHVGILNAMQEFAAMLDGLVTNANDPFAAVAFLRTYNQAEADMLTSFNTLTTYYKSKQP